jgi:hypothetical protein
VALVATVAIHTDARAADDTACQDSYVSGQRLYKLSHDLIGGRSQLLICAKTCPDELRESCGKWLQDIDQEVPSIVVKAKDGRDRDVADVSLVIDDKPVEGYVEGTPIELNPGAHTIRAIRGSHAPVEQRIVLSAGEKLRVVEIWTEPRVVDQFTTRTRRPIPTVSFALFGLGAVSLASFGVFSIWTTAEYSKTGSCTPNCATSDRDSAFGTKTILADVSLGLGAAAFVGAGIFYLARPTVTERIPKPASVWLSPTPRGVALGGTF